MKSICVYLGANRGHASVFTEAVVLLGEQIAQLGLQLVYGGSRLGLMGLLATTVMEQGGSAVGISINHLQEKEQVLSSLDELIIVETMQERKRLMQQKADAFMVFPGGLGTLEEALDTWNAIKIGILKKPMGFLNLEGYFDNLFTFINSCEKAGFVSSTQSEIPHRYNNSESLLAALFYYNKNFHPA